MLRFAERSTSVFALALMVTACSDDADTSCPDKSLCLVDAAPPASECDPAQQIGCAPGEKCTWIVDSEPPAYAGHVGCVEAGSLELNASCRFELPGSGFDQCATGFVCSDAFGGNGACTTICGTSDRPPYCLSGAECTFADGILTAGGIYIAGVCL